MSQGNKLQTQSKNWDIYYCAVVTYDVISYVYNTSKLTPGPPTPIGVHTYTKRFRMKSFRDLKRRINELQNNPIITNLVITEAAEYKLVPQVLFVDKDFI
ncbi:MAG: hypothetical protein ACP5N7_00865 [Candidatus Pacearchaeota archaeon]